MLDEAEVYAQWWHTSYDAKQKRCAEVLIPSSVPRAFIIGAFVASEAAKKELAVLVHGVIDVEVSEFLFYKRCSS